MSKRAKKVPQADANKEVSSGPHRWQPGESGNPSGRPKVVAEVRDLCRENTSAAVETLCEIMHNKNAPSAARVAAAAQILDRGYGKPTQTVVQHVRDLRRYTDDELIAFLDEIERREGTPVAPERSQLPH